MKLSGKKTLTIEVVNKTNKIVYPSNLGTSATSREAVFKAIIQISNFKAD
jgi:hypothetical protein